MSDTEKPASPATGGAHSAEHSMDHEVVIPDETPIHTGKVITVGVVSIAIFALGAVWAVKIELDTEKRQYPTGARPAIPQAVYQEENGIVDFVPFDLNQWKKKDLEANARVLHSAAWVDREKGVVRMPIDRAMELVAAAKAEAQETHNAPEPKAEPRDKKPAPAPKKGEKKK